MSSLGTLCYPGGIRTRVFLFQRRMRCPLRHDVRPIIVKCACFMNIVELIGPFRLKVLFKSFKFQLVLSLNLSKFTVQCRFPKRPFPKRCFPERRLVEQRLVE
jgi:hypothetical protein